MGRLLMIKTKLMAGSIVRIPVSFGYHHPRGKIARLTTHHVEAVFNKFTDETEEYVEVEYNKFTFVVSRGQLDGDYE